MQETLRVGVFGASGYVGAELVRLLSGHPRVRICLLTGERNAGRSMESVFGHLAGLPLPSLVSTAEGLQFAKKEKLAAVFCALPHGRSQTPVSSLVQHTRVIDLSADFRLRDAEVYRRWYGTRHVASELLGESVYGLSEHHRAQIGTARLVACPGCYPTAVLLALVPLVARNLVDAHDIVLDAKSGVSGAGRAERQANLFCEVGESLSAYGVSSHRHVPEIEQILSGIVGAPLRVSFTPHLVPMSRGELISCYLRLSAGQSPDTIRQALIDRYRDAPFVRVETMHTRATPSAHASSYAASTRCVRGSNSCSLSVFADRIPNRVIVFSVIDNLMKGSSGQAVQNLNLMFGLPEDTGLGSLPLFP